MHYLLLERKHRSLAPAAAPEIVFGVPALDPGPARSLEGFASWTIGALWLDVLICKVVRSIRWRVGLSAASTRWLRVAEVCGGASFGKHWEQAER